MNGTGKKYTFRYNDTNTYINKDFDSNNVTLYAQWTPAYTRIRYDGNGATGGSMADEFITVDKSYTLKNNAFTKKDYIFDGWEVSGTTYSAGSKINQYNATMEPIQTLKFTSGLESRMWYGQGGTIFEDGGKKYLLASYVPTSANTTNTNGDSWLYIYELDTQKIVRKKFFQTLAHVNDITWNPDEKCFVTTTRHKIDYNLNQVGKLNLSGGFSAITYKDGKYYGISGKTLYEVDSDGKIIKTYNNIHPELVDFNNNSVFAMQGSGATSQYLYTCGFIGSACNTYVLIKPFSDFSKVYFFNYLSGNINTSAGRKEVQDMYYDKDADKTYFLTDPSSGAVADGCTYLQIHNGDAIPTTTIKAKWKYQPPTGWYTISPSKSTLYRIGVTDGKTGTTAKLYRSNNKSGQKIHLTKLSDGTYKIGTGTTVGMSVLSNGLQQKKYNSTDKTQKWKIMQNDDLTTFSITNVSTNKAISYSSLTDDSALSETTKSATDEKQKFIINPFQETYTVTFTNGIGKVLKRQAVKKNESATAPANPTRTGYTFNGWDKNFTKVTKNITVNAKWK